MRTCSKPLVLRLGHTRTFRTYASNRSYFESPIGITAQLFSSIHELSGLTYGVTIPLTAIALRTIVTLPLSIYSQKKLNTRIGLRPLFFQWGNIISSQALELKRSQNKAPRLDKDDLNKMMSNVQILLSKRMNTIYRRHGCTKLRILLPTMIQIPLFIVVSIALRSMCGWGAWFDIGLGVPMDPLLQNEGFGAIKNLVQTDGSFILPVMIGLLSVTNLEASFSLTAARRAVTFSAERIPRIQKVMRVSLLTVSVLMIPLAMQAPAAICLYWFTSAAYSFLQNLLLQKFLPITSPYMPRLALKHRTTLTT